MEWIAELVGKEERALPNRDFLPNASVPDQGPRRVSRNHKMLLHIRGFWCKSEAQQGVVGTLLFH